MPMRRNLGALLALVALAVLLFGSARAGESGQFCCVCECGGEVSCAGAITAPACDPFFITCTTGMGGTCLTAAVNGSCAAMPECGAAPASAPSLGVTGLGLVVILLGGYGTLRLRRRTAP